MKHTTKVALIGGSGKAGKYLVGELLNQGFSLRLLLRNPETFAIQHPRIEVVQGDARNPEVIRSLLKDCQAVISTLGQPKDEPPVCSQATANVIQAMSAFGIQRYIVVTGLSIDLPTDKKSEKTRMKSDWMRANFPEAVADKQKDADFLTASTIDWTLVRVPFIVQTDEPGPIHVSLEDCLGDTISATDLARFLISQLSDRQYIQKSPFVSGH